MKHIDGRIFALSVGLLALVAFPLAVFPEASGRWITVTYDWLALNLGPLYLWAGMGTLGFSFFLAFGRYGGMILGQASEAPEFGNASWFAMLFCAGIASGLLYWGVIEWAYYFRAPPYAAEVGSTQGILWNNRYAQPQ